MTILSCDLALKFLVGLLKLFRNAQGRWTIKEIVLFEVICKWTSSGFFKSSLMYLEDMASGEDKYARLRACYGISNVDTNHVHGKPNDATGAVP